jgi:hypothetical protein
MCTPSWDTPLNSCNIKIIKIVMFQVTLLELDKDLTYPLLLSVNLKFNTALVPSQESGSTDLLPSSPPPQNVNEEG